MKSILVIVCLVLAVRLSKQQCVPSQCIASSNCLCMSTSPPGGLTVAQAPQIVSLAFDGAITKGNIQDYLAISNSGLLNPNGCPITMTFFVNHEYNDYSLMNQLYNRGHEIGTHSISHSTPSDTWATKDLETWSAEIGGMIYAAATYGNIRRADLIGQKSPFLQSAGDITFDAMAAKGVEYDSSYPSNESPPIWPYTMDFGLQHTCQTAPCPVKPHKNIWTFPMSVLRNHSNPNQIFTNAEGFSPKSEDDAFQFLKYNFELRYNTTRAPFVISQTGNAWFTSPDAPFTFAAFMRFLRYINEKDEVYIVPLKKALAWMKKPTSFGTSGNTGQPFSCPSVAQQPCVVRNCNYDDEHCEASLSGIFGGGRMPSCSACPDRCPYVCNPAGKDPAPSTCDQGV